MCERTIACPQCDSAIGDQDETKCTAFAGGDTYIEWVCPRCAAIVGLTSRPSPVAGGSDRDGEGS